MKILGVETSADDTGLAIINAEGIFGPQFTFSILSNVVSSQLLHALYGGIFPAMAKREHAKNLPLLFRKIENNGPADAIAVTAGPGLEPCLWTGITFAQELAQKWSVPIVGVNHMEGHIIMSMVSVANMDDKEKLAKNNHQKTDRAHSNVLKYSVASATLKQFEFPALALLISGGHTELVLVKEFGHYEIIGKTRDDAVGEAFDKVARMLGFPYPGGPVIAKFAEEARTRGLTREPALPRPMLHENNFDFSFAGLKTAVLRQVENRTLSEDDKRAVAREFEEATAEVLVAKTMRAAEEHGVQTVLLGGGVSANAHIRRCFAETSAKMGMRFLVCPTEHSTDNGLMIALAGYFRALKREFTNPSELIARGNLKLGERA